MTPVPRGNSTDGVPGGSFDAGRLLRQWDLIEQRATWLDHADHLAQQTNILSERRFDEAQLLGLETYISARQLIGASLDNIRTVRTLITNHGVTPWAPWVLLRASFEAAALAVWLLDPENGLERRRRGLRRAVDDRRQWASWQETFAREDPVAFQQFEERRQKVKQRHAAQAKELGISPQQANARPNLVDELPKLRVLQGVRGAKPEWFATMWRSLSGMTHGLPYAAVANTNQLEEHRLPGGSYSLRSVNETSWNAHAMACSLLLLDAITLYRERAESAH